MIQTRLRHPRPTAPTLHLALAALLIGAAAAPAALLDVSDGRNILAGPGRTITVSSVFAGGGGLDQPSGLIDNLAADNTQDGSFLFGQPPGNGGTDSPNKLSISGFNSGFSSLRIFTAGDPTREPTNIIVRSSTSLVTSLNAGDYETFLGSFAFAGPPSTGISLSAYPIGSPPPANARGYFDLALSTPAPAGTRSLYMELADPLSGIRIYELQALIPEPGTLMLLGTGGLLVWRARRVRR